MRYAYQNNGAGMIRWPGGKQNSSPYQSRAADARSLGSLGGTTLPAPGAPEPLNGDDLMSSYPMKAVGDCGCGCKGAGTCGGGMGHDGIGDIVDTITGHPVIAAGVAYLAYRMFFKKKRR